MQDTLKRIFFLILAPALLGQACLKNLPQAYGARLDVCEETSKDWAEFEACCIQAARDFGRDPSFCLSGRDRPNAK